MHPYLAREHPLRLAHRGSRVLWPENTMEAFQGVVDLGYLYVETDVRLTRDGVVVVFHDATLERLTNGAGKVAEWRRDELAVLDAGFMHGSAEGYPYRGKGVGIPTLEEVLVTWPDVNFNIDLKAPSLEAPVADLVGRLARQDTVLIASFSDRRLARFRRLMGGVATSAGSAAALAMWSSSRVGRARRRAPEAYQVPFDQRGMPIDDRFIAAAHDSGAQVHTWTVNESADMRRLLDLGVDGIVTDRPDLLNEVVAGRR
jgi:glycerophosphoryl diester phosphodiesterase